MSKHVDWIVLGIVLGIFLLVALSGCAKGTKMADGMINATQITNTYGQAWKEEYKKSGDRTKARQAGCSAVKKAGYYLDKGKWKRIKPSATPQQKSEYLSRADENKALLKFRVRSRMA